ncbi:MAG: signal peptidase I [Microbacterium pygmaeum]
MSSVVAPTPKPTRQQWWRRVIGNPWFHLIAAFVVVGLVLSFVAKPYWVPSGSMENTLQPGDRILVNRLAFVGSSPATGDVIVFDADAKWDATPPPETDLFGSVAGWIGQLTGFGPSGPHTLIKRVIGGPGQRVECCTDTGAVIVDGKPLTEPYVWNDFEFTPDILDCDSAIRSPRCFDEVTVPADSYLMLGDNRANSADSAVRCRTDDAAEDCWRWATGGGVVGKAVVILWPIGRWSGL